MPRHALLSYTNRPVEVNISTSIYMSYLNSHGFTFDTCNQLRETFYSHIFSTTFEWYNSNFMPLPVFNKTLLSSGILRVIWLKSLNLDI